MKITDSERRQVCDLVDWLGRGSTLKGKRLLNERLGYRPESNTVSNWLRPGTGWTKRNRRQTLAIIAREAPLMKAAHEREDAKAARPVKTAIPVEKTDYSETVDKPVPGLPTCDSSLNTNRRSELIRSVLNIVRPYPDLFSITFDGNLVLKGFKVKRLSDAAAKADRREILIKAMTVIQAFPEFFGVIMDDDLRVEGVRFK